VIGKDKLAETSKDISMILSSNTLRQMIKRSAERVSELI
jgi:hypothetical protein